MTAEERAQLERQLPNFVESPKLQYLAGKKLLPQQNDMESFENAGFLTQARRSVYGLTKREEQLIKRQQEALVPFEQEQQIKTKLQALLPTMGDVAPLFSGLAPFTSAEQPLGLSGGKPIVPTDQEMGTLRARESEFSPLYDPRQKITQPQSDLLEQATKGQVVLPGQQFLPTALSKEPSRQSVHPVQPGQPIYDPNTGKFIMTPGEKTEKPSFHFTTMVNPATGVDEEVKINPLTNEKTFLGPKGSPEAAKAKKDAQSLEARREVENEAKTRIGRAMGFAGFKESPFDAAGNIDIARLLAPGAVDLDKLMYWAQSAIDEPGLQKPVKVQLQHFLKQIKDEMGRAKKAPEAPKAGSVLRFDIKGNPIK